MRRVVLIWVALAGVAVAEPRPAPDYFIDVTFAATTAQALAKGCATLSFELLRASRDSGDVMRRLSEDGFDLDALADDMVNPAATFADLRDAFIQRHQLMDGAAQNAVCAAGLAEIEAASQIGRYLTQVPGQ